MAFDTYRVGFDKAVKEKRWAHKAGAMAPTSACSYVLKTAAGFEALLADGNGNEEKAAYVARFAFKYTNYVLNTHFGGVLLS